MDNAKVVLGGEHLRKSLVGGGYGGEATGLSICFIC